jgi:UDP-N-acetylglucosamine 4-epimerase
MSPYDQIRNELRTSPKTWLVTGAAGFIGSNLLQALLKLDQRVTGLDNFCLGSKDNLEQVQASVSPAQWERFHFIEGDIAKVGICRRVCERVDFVLHQAALGSVPRSMTEPLASHDSNVTGFVNMLLAAKEAHVRRFVYASSSAVYGDSQEMPKTEEKTGHPLSPYAATKASNEIYAAAFAQAYSFKTIGLRYFNVFGPRQDPNGAYAAVIPKWISALLKRETVYVNGDGETSRDFCYIENVVQANLLSAVTTNPEAVDNVYNIALGERTSLNELFKLLQAALRQVDPSVPEQKPVYRDFQPGDVRHSLADISKAQQLLGYAPTHPIRQGLDLAMDWYRRNSS